ncbi:vWA domain-containing protein [Sorangium sp. So ce117]|uniref:vWA domain-containing protein n=1 Tax=Sorangium sp. So ce117 TaxID=3133277 RepID=UPI003F628B09
MNRFFGFIMTVASGIVMVGCAEIGASDVGSFDGSGEFGATPGGVKDMGLARGLVENGRVPPAEAFVVEAMFSEHDLPLEGAPCATLLCVRAAMGIAPDAQGESAAWVQVGMSSTIDPETFKRPSMAIVATVDVSGSMSWGYGDGEGGMPAAIAHSLLGNVASSLDANDRFALVTYGSSVSTPLDWTQGDDPEIKETIDELSENGSTNMEAGLIRAYELAREAKGTADEVRVMLFTDVQPNVGATGGSEFERLVAEGAEDGIGITVFGLGLGLGVEVMNRMSHLRGANAFSLMNADEVGLFMEDNWPWMATPIAHDLSLVATPSPGLSLTHAYGFPTGEAGATSIASLDVASVFLSKRKGALLLSLTPASPEEIAGSAVEVALSYVDRSGEPVTSSLSARYDGEALDERGVVMPQASVDKTVALALLVQAMHDAAQAYGSDPAAAIATLEPALERFAADAAAIGDAGIDAEAAFWPALLDLMKADAPRGDLYGDFSDN